MIDALRKIWSDLKQPGTAPGWYAWTTNQCGHAIAIGFPLGMLMASLGAVAPLWAVTAGVVGKVYFILWERLIQAGGDRRDSTTDAAFVALGAGVYLEPLAWFAFFGALVAGAVRRARNG